MRHLLLYLVTALLLSACIPAESPILAQVGDAKLTTNDVRLQMPLSMTGADSAAFVREYVDEWVNEQLLYQQGMRNVPDLDKLEQLAAQYRRDLISLTYENELMRGYAEEVSDDECLAFYEKYQKQLRLEEAIVQGFYIKLLSNSSRVRELKDWLKQMQSGIMDHAEELEQYCQQRAVDYDSFMDSWENIHRLTDRLPVTVVDAGQFLRCQVYEMKDDDYIHLFLVSDFRLAGEIEPFEHAKADVHELLLQQKHREFRKRLLKSLRDEALRTGELKIN
ncbi:MAG: hypothetical protein KBT20_03090 [Bacteroidales bacterium]|nr:hypothetical protein [Candidatus Liminaster caballi]